MKTNRLSASKGTKTGIAAKQQNATASGANEGHFQPCESMTLIPANELVKLSIPTRKKHWGPLIQSNQTGMMYGERGGGSGYVIPIVFHIIHNNGPENITDGPCDVSKKDTSNLRELGR